MSSRVLFVYLYIISEPLQRSLSLHRFAEFAAAYIDEVKYRIVCCLEDQITRSHLLFTSIIAYSCLLLYTIILCLKLLM